MNEHEKNLSEALAQLGLDKFMRAVSQTIGEHANAIRDNNENDPAWRLAESQARVIRAQAEVVYNCQRMYASANR